MTKPIRSAVLALSLALVAPSVLAQALPPAAPARAPAAAGPTEDQIAALENVPQLLALGAQYQRQNDLKKLALVLERLVTLRPQTLPFRYELAAAYAQMDDKSKAYDALLKLHAIGYAGTPEDDARFDRIHGTEVWQYIVENLKANRAPFGEGKVAHTLPAGDTMHESLAWDPVGKTLLVGSMRDGTVQRLGAKGKLEPFIAADAKNGMWAVTDLAVDAKNNALWVASSAIPHFKHNPPKDLGRAALFKFDLKTGAFLGRYETPPSPRGHVLTSVVVTPSGLPYAVNGASRQIFRVREKALEIVVTNPRLDSIRGIAVSGDGKTLYLADYEQGLFGLDLDKGQGFSVALPPKLSLYAIEGIYWYQNNLVVVQNGFPPARVMRLTLDPTGRKIVRSQALEASKPEMTLPTRGTLAGDDFYFIANSQKTQYDSYGLPRDKSKLEGVKIYRTNARFVWEPPTTPQPPQFAPAAPVEPKKKKAGG